jgi:hypothetical protein
MPVVCFDQTVKSPPRRPDRRPPDSGPVAIKMSLDGVGRLGPKPIETHGAHRLVERPPAVRRCRSLREPIAFGWRTERLEPSPARFPC